MSSDDHAPPAGNDTRSRGDAGESLKSALDDLESILGQHQPADAPDDGDARAEADESGDEDGQYTIPLLNDVVLPPSVAPAKPRREPLDDDYQDAVERMTERLSSEIDVIVESAVEEAVELLRRDIAERLREHIEITLPEVLEELVQQRRDR